MTWLSLLEGFHKSSIQPSKQRCVTWKLLLIRGWGVLLLRGPYDNKKHPFLDTRAAHLRQEMLRCLGGSLVAHSFCLSFLAWEVAVSISREQLHW